MKEQNELHEFMKNEMNKRSMSLRRFSSLINIDHGTLSKIMNGKRQANLNHLQKLSENLSTDFESLLKLAGYKAHDKDDLEKTWEAVQKIAEELISANESISFERMNQEISRFEIYSQSAAGQERIHKEFNTKMKETTGLGKYVEQLKAMYTHFINGHGHVTDQILIGAALLYFIVTTDLMPDYILPVGLLDDAFIVRSISQRLENKNILL